MLLALLTTVMLRAPQGRAEWITVESKPSVEVLVQRGAMRRNGEIRIAPVEWRYATDQPYSRGNYRVLHQLVAVDCDKKLFRIASTALYSRSGALIAETPADQITRTKWMATPPASPGAKVLGAMCARDR